MAALPVTVLSAVDASEIVKGQGLIEGIFFFVFSKTVLS